MPQRIRRKFRDHVKKAISRIDDINNVEKVNLTIGALWPPLQLKAVTEVLKIGTRDHPDARFLYQAWFKECVVSAL